MPNFDHDNECEYDKYDDDDDVMMMYLSISLANILYHTMYCHVL